MCYIAFRRTKLEYFCYNWTKIDLHISSVFACVWIKHLAWLDLAWLRLWLCWIRYRTETTLLWGRLRNECPEPVPTVGAQAYTQSHAAPHSLVLSRWLINFLLSALSFFPCPCPFTVTEALFFAVCYFSCFQLHNYPYICTFWFECVGNTINICFLSFEQTWVRSGVECVWHACTQARMAKIAVKIYEWGTKWIMFVNTNCPTKYTIPKR